MSQESNLGSGARGAGTRNGKVFINEKEGRIEFYDDNAKLVRASYGDRDIYYDPDTGEVMTIGNVTERTIADGQYGIVFKDINGDDKTFLGPKSSGIIETYFAGKLACALTGGTLDGVTYSAYLLTITLYHRFSTKFPLFQPMYEWWGQERYNSNNGVRTRARIMPTLQYSGGSATQSTGLANNVSNGELTFESGAVDSGDPTNPNTEYMRWVLNLTRVSGTIVIPAQTFYLVAYLYYLNQVLPTLTAVPVYAQGGGGGTLSESLNFYI